MHLSASCMQDHQERWADRAICPGCTVEFTSISILQFDARTQTVEPSIVGITMNPPNCRWMPTLLCFTCWPLFNCFFLLPRATSHSFPPSPSLAIPFPTAFLLYPPFCSSSCVSCTSFFSSSLKCSKLVSTRVQPDGFGCISYHLQI